MRSLPACIPLAIAPFSLSVSLSACSKGEPPQIVTSTATPTSTAFTTTNTPTPKVSDRPITANKNNKIFLDKPVTSQNPTNNSVVAVLQQTAPNGLIATTSKSQRQQELLARVNSQNPSHDPFSNIPGTVSTPPLPPPPPLKLPPIVRPQTVAVPPPRPYVPPQPVQKEAETVKVTGTVEIAGRRYAIVSVPGDVTSQYVRVGQRIAGNKVLVKYIETAGTPMVILQQNGVEFTRYIK